MIIQVIEYNNNNLNSVSRKYTTCVGIYHRCNNNI